MARGSTFDALRKVPSFAWAAMSLGASAAVLAYALRRPKGPTRIAMIGDSLAVGLGPQLTKIAKSAGVPFRYQGVTSTTPLQWSTKAAACGTCGSWVSSFAPSVVLIVLGTNDIGYSPSPPVAPYTSLVDQYGQNSMVIWVDPPMMPSDRLAGVRSVIASLGVPVVPAMTGLSFGADNIHPTNYAPWAQFIWSTLQGDL